ncbi:uncharacterized protein LOC144664651 isoform X2 [Oculina patagonica]
MRYSQLVCVILGIIFVAENGRRSIVFGMPVDGLDGSKLCRSNIKSNAAGKERSQIAFEVLYWDTTSVPANSVKCNLEFWNEAVSLNMPQGNKRSFSHLGVRLTKENPKLFKIFVDKGSQDWFESNVNSIASIVCPSRKFSCIRFLSTEKGASHVRRSLLSVGQLYTYEDPGGGIPLKLLILVLAGAVILVVAGSLCADCNKTKDDESVSEARPQLVSCQQRTSQRKSTPEEQQIQEEIVFESKDAVVMETAEKIEGDSVDANNHKPQTTIAHYEPPPSSVQHELPCSTQPPVSPSSTQHVPPSGTRRVSPSATPHEPQISSHPHAPETEPGAHANSQPTQPSGSQPEAEAGERTSRASKAGSSKKKRGSEHEHEEHKGKFWKRTRSAKGSSTSGTAKPVSAKPVSAPLSDRTSDAAFKEEEHKNRRSRKESKELKTKSGKTKGRTGSTDSEKDEKNVVHDDHIERAREATPTLERQTRGLPPPPGTSGPALPTRPVPQRQLSAPEGAEEDSNYETVDYGRKTKSLERFKAAPKPADDAYDVVEIKIGKPRDSSLDDYDSVVERSTGAQRTSDIYEVVPDTDDTVDYLYSEVEKTGSETGKKIDIKNEKMVEDEKVDELEDPYSRIKYQKQLEAAGNSSELDKDVEDPYSKIKYPRQEEETENTELYEDIDKGQENGDKNHKYSAVDKGEVLRLMIESGTNMDSSDRNRSQSDAAALQQSGNELPRRPNTIHVVQSTKGEVTQTKGEVASVPFDYTYAEVDLSKKTRRPRNTESGEGTEEENYDSDNPPPLPPAYVSSRQIQIEMGRIAGSSINNADNLYDEVATASQRERPPNMELLPPDDESNRLSSVSDDYELVEVGPQPFRTTADDYTEVVEREPRPKVGSGGRAGPVHVEICGAPANISVTVTSSSEVVDNNVDNEEIPHYESVAPKRERKERSSVSNGEWL